MRQFFLLSSFLVMTITSAAQVIDLGKCNPKALSPSGFSQMKNIIGDARIVVIGEQNHGVGTDY